MVYVFPRYKKMEIHELDSPWRLLYPVAATQIEENTFPLLWVNTKLLYKPINFGYKRYIVL